MTITNLLRKSSFGINFKPESPLAKPYFTVHTSLGLFE